MSKFFDGMGDDAKFLITAIVCVAVVLVFVATGVTVYRCMELVHRPAAVEGQK